ncbi:DOG1 domain-containing protein [Artemisia annua]|uniref:DOG1 domain-containing protein n=1 Tax=Artemisia annua TaxID=35608 RepID=A0A2U1NY32_ARTAN|nr:DOG1 domain-containing protein [Artemisia annua]
MTGTNTVVKTPERTHSQIFHQFFDHWLIELGTNLEQLVSAANHNKDNNHDDSNLRHLIDKSVKHYEEFYKAKSDSAKGDVKAMFRPPWLTSLEDAFLWIAGWRPTTAIHLLYSKSGLQLEARLDESVPVLLRTGDLGDLSLHQINRVDELQRKTIRAERAITEKMAKLQESAADSFMVDLSSAASENLRKNDGDGEVKEGVGTLNSLLESKEDKLEEVLHMADGLRMETLKSVVGILTPIQAVHFLIAAAELHLRIHDWGQKRDAT